MQTHQPTSASICRVGVNVIATQSGTQTSGNLLMYREDGPKVTHQNTQVLVLAVSGDSLLAITNYVSQKNIVDRPLALDLLWQVPGTPSTNISHMHRCLLVICTRLLHPTSYTCNILISNTDAGWHMNLIIHADHALTF